MTQGVLGGLTVRLENKPGSLGRAARLLSDAGINLDAVEAEVLGTHGFFRLYCREAARAMAVLRERGYVVTAATMLEVTVGNKPGELARCCEVLAAAGVNIDSCFGSTWGTQQECHVFLRVADMDRAQRVLDGAGFAVRALED